MAVLNFQAVSSPSMMMLVSSRVIKTCACPYTLWSYKIIEVGRETKGKRNKHTENKLEHFPSCEDQTHLLEVWHVQQGGDFKFVKKLSEVFEGMLGSGKDGAEAGNDIQQGVEQAICFRGYQSLTGQQKEKKME